MKPLMRQRAGALLLGQVDDGALQLVVRAGALQTVAAGAECQSKVAVQAQGLGRQAQHVGQVHQAVPCVVHQRLALVLVVPVAELHATEPERGLEVLAGHVAGAALRAGAAAVRRQRDVGLAERGIRFDDLHRVGHHVGHRLVARGELLVHHLHALAVSDVAPDFVAVGFALLGRCQYGPVLQAHGGDGHERLGFLARGVVGAAYLLGLLHPVQRLRIADDPAAGAVTVLVQPGDVLRDLEAPRPGRAGVFGALAARASARGQVFAGAADLLAHVADGGLRSLLCCLRHLGGIIRGQPALAALGLPLCTRQSIEPYLCLAERHLPVVRLGDVICLADLLADVGRPQCGGLGVLGRHGAHAVWVVGCQPVLVRPHELLRLLLGVNGHGPQQSITCRAARNVSTQLGLWGRLPLPRCLGCGALCGGLGGGLGCWGLLFLLGVPEALKEFSKARGRWGCVAAQQVAAAALNAQAPALQPHLRPGEFTVAADAAVRANFVAVLLRQRVVLGKRVWRRLRLGGGYLRFLVLVGLVHVQRFLPLGAKLNRAGVGRDLGQVQARAVIGQRDVRRVALVVPGCACIAVLLPPGLHVGAGELQHHGALIAQRLDRALAARHRYRCGGRLHCGAVHGLAAVGHGHMQVGGWQGLGEALRRGPCADGLGTGGRQRAAGVQRLGGGWLCRGGLGGFRL